MNKPIRLIAFIDLLGTKESHIVSGVSFAEHLEAFCRVIVEHAAAFSGRNIEIEHFSDCAFITSSGDPDDLFRYLSLVRESLLRGDRYFKAGIAIGHGARFSPDQARDRIFANQSQQFAKVAESVCTFRLFGPEVVPAYLLHEGLKGVGFAAQPDIARSYPDRFVESLHLGGIQGKQYTSFFDLRFDGTLVDACYDPINLDEDQFSDDGIPVARAEATFVQRLGTGKGIAIDNRRQGSSREVPLKQISDSETEEGDVFDRLIRSMKRAYVKDPSYPKYYLSVLYTLVKSSVFSLIWYDGRRFCWRGYPYVFYRLVSCNLYRKTLRKFRGYEIILAAMLNEILVGIDARREPLLAECEWSISHCRRKDLLPVDFSVGASVVSSGDIIPSDEEELGSDVAMDFRLLRDAEKRIIRDYMGLRGQSVAGELRAIPDFVLAPKYKRRVEHEYSLIE